MNLSFDVQGERLSKFLRVPAKQGFWNSWKPFKREKLKKYLAFHYLLYCIKCFSMEVRHSTFLWSLGTSFLEAKLVCSIYVKIWYIGFSTNFQAANKTSRFHNSSCISHLQNPFVSFQQTDTPCRTNCTESLWLEVF